MKILLEKFRKHTKSKWHDKKNDHISQKRIIPIIIKQHK